MICRVFLFEMNVFEVVPAYLIEQNRIKIQSNPIEHQSLDRTKSNTYQCCFELDYRTNHQSNKIERSRIETGSILFEIHFFIGKSRRGDHNQPLLNGTNRKTSKYLFGFLTLSTFLLFRVRENKQ